MHCLKSPSLLSIRQMPFCHLRFRSTSELPEANSVPAIQRRIPEFRLHQHQSGYWLFLLGVIDLDDVSVDQHLAGVSAEVVRPQLAHLVANYAQFLLIQADFFADGSCTVWHIKELLSLYNGHLFAVC